MSGYGNAQCGRCGVFHDLVVTHVCFELPKILAEDRNGERIYSSQNKCEAAQKENANICWTCGIEVFGPPYYVHMCNGVVDTARLTRDEVDVTQNEGIKHDQDKPRMDLIAPEMQIALGEILGFGAQKYSCRNWEEGMKWGRVFASLMRHMWAWWGKAESDPETGKSHLWHAAACIMFLIAYEARSVGEDDRAITTTEGK